MPGVPAVMSPHQHVIAYFCSDISCVTGCLVLLFQGVLLGRSGWAGHMVGSGYCQKSGAADLICWHLCLCAGPFCLLQAPWRSKLKCFPGPSAEDTVLHWESAGSETPSQSGKQRGLWTEVTCGSKTAVNTALWKQPPTQCACICPLTFTAESK